MKLEIIRNSVPSSNVKSIGYDTPFKLLDIEFKNGGLYRYMEVPSETYIKLMGAASLGSFIAHHIKGKFDCSFYANAEDETETKFIPKNEEITN